MAEQTAPEAQMDHVECKTSKDYSIRRFIIAAILLSAGGYCFYDAYIVQSYKYVEFAKNMNGWLTWAFNYYLPYVTIPAGLAVAIWQVIMLRRILAADAAGIGYAGKEKLAWDAISRLDATDIRKGYLRLEYGQGQKLVVLDSFKLQNFRDMVAFVEKHVPADKHAR